MPNRLFHSSLLILLVAFAGALAPAGASAQSVVVLGISSVEGDDEFARNLTGALRHAASQVDGWTLSDREVTLSQMALAHGCDEQPDETCMAQIARSLEAQRVVYGEVRRTGGEESFDFSLNLHIFNAESGRIEHSIPDRIPGVRRDIDDLREPARRWMAALTGAPRVGTLRITVNVPGAQVFVDDQPVGTADSEGLLVVEGVQAGNRSVRVVAAGHQNFSSTVSIEPYAEARFEAELHEGAGGGGGGGVSGDLVAGISLLVVAAALAGGWIGSWVQLNNLSSDPDFEQYRLDASRFVVETGRSTDPTTFNVCSLAQSNVMEERLLVQNGMTGARADVATRANTVCNQADVYEILQYVFAGAAALAGGLGIYFVAAGASGGAPAERAQAIRIAPSIGPNHAFVSLTASF